MRPVQMYCIPAVAEGTWMTKFCCALVTEVPYKSGHFQSITLKSTLLIAQKKYANNDDECSL